jgi:hypothetical protein
MKGDYIWSVGKWRRRRAIKFSKLQHYVSIDEWPSIIIEIINAEIGVELFVARNRILVQRWRPQNPY